MNDHKKPFRPLPAEEYQRLPLEQKLVYLEQVTLDIGEKFAEMRKKQDREGQ